VTERDAYVAGLIDGEGTVTANLRPSPRTGRDGLHYRIMLSNSHHETIRWLGQHYGGKVYMPRARNAKHKALATWYIGSVDAVAVLIRVLPYLRIKRRQARIVLLLSRLGYVYGRAGHREVSDSRRRRRVVLVEEISRLNHRGI
jgi:hypothetical protein